MTDAMDATGRNSLGRTGTPLLVAVRLALGLLQGVALWWLYRSRAAFDTICDSRDGCPDLVAHWPATVPELFGPLSMILVMVPALLLAGVGRMRPFNLLLWALGATTFLALLGWHDVASHVAGEHGSNRYPPFLTWPMPLFAATALFIGHHLVLPADMERRWIAAFPTYFDTAWKAGVQLALSIGFTGALWILLFLGSALFKVIGLDFLEELISRDWFSIPVTCLTFATAVHLTDVRDGLIRGVRSVVLMLLSWLLLLMTVLAAGFLGALPFTGLNGLWETGSATSLVLAAAAALIILINTAYQDGRADNLPPLILRATVQVAAVLLTPLIIIAFWGLALRIGQHGLTPDRIIAFACAVIGAAYAAGYGFAALSPFWRKATGWMQSLESTNVWTAVLEVAVILALFSPIADPSRLSVMDQVARLERGAVTPEQFDYRFLRFESGKLGQAALERLTRSADAEVSRRAREIQASHDRWESRQPVPAGVERPTIASWPSGSQLPETFLAPGQAAEDERGQCRPTSGCVATALDLNGDGRREMVLGTSHSLEVFELQTNGTWLSVGYYDASNCKSGATLIRQGGLQIRPSPWPDITIGGLDLDYKSRTDPRPKTTPPTGSGANSADEC